MEPKINVIKINGGFIRAIIGYNPVNESYHIWLSSKVGNSDTLLSCCYDNQSFEDQINRWCVDWSCYNPTRINFDSFDSLIEKYNEGEIGFLDKP